MRSRSFSALARCPPGSPLTEAAHALTCRRQARRERSSATEVVSCLLCRLAERALGIHEQVSKWAA